MWQLPMPEKSVFVVSCLAYLMAAMVGIVQLSATRRAWSRALVPLVCVGVCLEMVVLVFRAVAIKAVPLTGLFESMMLLTMVLALIYVVLSVPIQQIWFGSVMAWLLAVLSVLSATVAQPATTAVKAASTPWAIFHASAMVLSGALIMFSTGIAALYLFSQRQLKHKKVLTVLGRVPNLQWLAKANARSLKLCFISQTIGLFCGIGLVILQAVPQNSSLSDWMVDPKILLIAVAWVLLLVVMVGRGVHWLSDKGMAYATLAVFFLVLFASVGVVFIWETRHAFV